MSDTKNNERDPRIVSEQVEKKLKECRGVGAELIGNVKLLWAMLKAATAGKNIPKATVATIVGALLYFVIPTDIIPDFIPLAGYLDDATVVGVAISAIGYDIDKFKESTEEEDA